MLTKCSFSWCNISLNHYEILCMYLSGGFHSPSPQYYGSYDTLIGNTPYHQEAVSLSPSHILSCRVHFLLWRILCVCVCVFSHSDVSDSLLLPGCSVHGIFQARIQEWITISFSRGSILVKCRV